MFKLIIVGTGGFIGSILRFSVNGLFLRFFEKQWLPYGTLAVNILGCLVIGFLGGLAENRLILNPEIRLLIFIGLLGSFTTYSSFGNETVNMLRNDQLLAALSNITFQLVFGLGAVWIGNILSHFFD